VSARISNDCVSHYQAFSLRPEERHFAGTFSADTDHFECSDFFAGVKFTVEDRALRFRIRGVVGMNVRTRAGPLANAIRRADMISVSDENPAHSFGGEFAENFFAGLDRIDT